MRVFESPLTLIPIVTRYAPRIFAYVDRAGRPLVSTITIIAFAPLAYINIASTGEVVFGWLLSLSGLAALFTWGSICMAHIRFRQAWKYHGHTLDELPFQSPMGIYGSILGLALIILVLIAQVKSLPLIGPPAAYTELTTFRTLVLRRCQRRRC